MCVFIFENVIDNFVLVDCAMILKHKARSHGLAIDIVCKTYI